MALVVLLDTHYRILRLPVRRWPARDLSKRDSTPPSTPRGQDHRTTTRTEWSDNSGDGKDHSRRPGQDAVHRAHSGTVHTLSMLQLRSGLPGEPYRLGGKCQCADLYSGSSPFQQLLVGSTGSRHNSRVLRSLLQSSVRLLLLLLQS